jgi:transcriptional regulator with XRE-family HTH domain
MRILREDRLLKRQRGGRRRWPGLALHCSGGHPQAVSTQKTQIRKQLGAQIKRARRLAGVKTQADLAAKTGLSIGVISLAERGAKVEPQTLRLIELALGFPDGTFEAFLEGRITDLAETRPAPSAQERGRAAMERLVAMDYKDLLEEAAVYDAVEPGSGEAWLRRVLAIREKARAKPSGTRETADRDAETPNSRK